MNAAGTENLNPLEFGKRVATEFIGCVSNIEQSELIHMREFTKNKYHFMSINHTSTEYKSPYSLLFELTRYNPTKDLDHIVIAGIRFNVDERDGRYKVVRHEHSEGPHSNELFADFYDVMRAGFDFRSYYTRMAEIYSCVPKKQWHDPLIYNRVHPLDTIVSSTLSALFTGDEYSALKDKIQEANIRLHGGFNSVPRLNLGVISLPPTKGSVSTESVLEGAPHLIMQLSELGIMSDEKAEEIVTTKLTNYFVRNGKFQVSREQAQETLRAITEKAR